MSNIRYLCCKPRLLVFVNLLAGLSMAAMLRELCHTPMSNAASHDNQEKINSFISFSFLMGFYFKALQMGCQSSANDCYLSLFILAV